MSLSYSVSARPDVSSSTRFQVFRRDGFACRYCGQSAPDAALVIEHVVPVVLGGSGHPSNLLTSCWSCNAGKGKTTPDGPTVEQVSADTIRWAEAMKAAADLIRSDLMALNGNEYELMKAWNEWADVYAEPGIEWSPENFTTVRDLLEAGLPFDIARMSMELTFARAPLAADRRFAYWQAVCREHIKVIHMAALARVTSVFA